MFNLLNNNTILLNNNTFNIGFYDYKILQGYFEVGQLGYYFKWPSKFLEFEPFVWYSFCLVYNEEISSIQFMVNDLVVFNKSIKRYPEALKYSLSSNINSDLEFPFTGKITDLNMWNEPLSVERVSLFSKCKMTELLQLNIGMPIRWSDSIFKMISNETKKFSISYEELCPQKIVSTLQLFHLLVKFEEAKAICIHLNSQIKLPMDYDDLKDILILANTNQMNNVCRGQIWMPIVNSKENYTKWVNSHKPSEEISFLPWMEGQPNGFDFQNCVCFKDGNYSDIECNYEHCFVCDFIKSPIFYLRGICPGKEDIDSKYTFNFQSNKNGDYIFQGLAGLTNIVGSVAKNSWEFITYNRTNKDPIIIGTLSPLKKLPIGANTWKLLPCGNETIKLTKVITHIWCFFVCGGGVSLFKDMLGNQSRTSCYVLWSILLNFCASRHCDPSIAFL